MTMREHIPYAPGEDEHGWTWITRDITQSLDTIRGYTMAGWQLVTWDETDIPDVFSGEPSYVLLFVENDGYIEKALKGVKRAE